MAQTQTNPQQPPQTTREAYTVSFAQANIYAIVTGLGPALLLFAAYIAVWSLQGMARGLIPLPLLAVLLIGIGGIVLHELLHLAGWLVTGRLPLDAVSLGFKLKLLTPYAHARQPMPARAYRWGVVLPGLLLGIVPALLAILLGNGTLMIFGFFFTAVAGGDFLILWLLRNVPATALVEDHPTEVGGYVYSPPDTQ